MVHIDHWQTAHKGLKTLLYRKERIFLSLHASTDAVQTAKLVVSGIVHRVFVNGLELTGKKNEFNIPVHLLKPWENEFFIKGWVITARLEVVCTPESKPVSIKEQESDSLGLAANALISFVIQDGPDKGDMFSFYDPVANTYRMPRWRWDTGICLEAMARLAAVNGNVELKQAVKTVADRFLDVQIKNDACLGGFPEASDLHLAGPDEAMLPEWVVPFNGAFIGGGLLAAMEVVDAPPKDACLKAAVSANELVRSKCLTDNGFLKGYFHLKDSCWKYHGQINDSGIYPRLSCILKKYSDALYIDAVAKYSNALNSFIQPESYVGRARWMADENTFDKAAPLFPEWTKHPNRIPAKIFARGQAWYLLGASGYWELSGSTVTGALVKQVVNYLLAHQDDSGMWHHDIRQPGQGLDVKGTAVVCWALLESKKAYEGAGGDSAELIRAVRKAWNALLRNQEEYMSGPVPGALCDKGKEGAIIYFRNRPMYTAYGTAAFILTGLMLQGEE